jgi:hypothetical protein
MTSCTNGRHVRIVQLLQAIARQVKLLLREELMVLLRVGEILLLKRIALRRGQGSTALAGPPLPRDSRQPLDFKLYRDPRRTHFPHQVSTRRKVSPPSVQRSRRRA